MPETNDLHERALTALELGDVDTFETLMSETASPLTEPDPEPVEETPVEIPRSTNPPDEPVTSPALEALELTAEEAGAAWQEAEARVRELAQRDGAEAFTVRKARREAEALHEAFKQTQTEARDLHRAMLRQEAHLATAEQVLRNHFTAEAEKARITMMIAREKINRVPPSASANERQVFYDDLATAEKAFEDARTLAISPIPDAQKVALYTQQKAKADERAAAERAAALEAAKPTDPARARSYERIRTEFGL
jgi:hypothetical protein